MFRSSSDDSSDDSSSDSDSEPDIKGKASAKPSQEQKLGDDDEEGGAGANITAEQMRTKNEVGDDTVVIPEITEVGENEVLDKVEEIMSIIDKVVIVKGTPSQVQSRGSEKALDSDTLLVFEDRKVFGYVSVPFVHLWLVWLTPHRYGKLLAQRASRSIECSSMKHTL